MRSLKRLSTLMLAMLMVNCAPQESAVDETAIDVNANVPRTEHDSDPATVTPTPVETNRAMTNAVTHIEQATATKTSTASPPPTRVSAATPEATTTHHPTATVVLMPSYTVTAQPTDLVMPSAGRQPANKTADAAALAERGIEVYQKQYCGICHQLDAAGTSGMFGPTHNDFAQTVEQRLDDPGYAGAAPTVEEYVRESIVSPESYVVEGYEHTSHHMPAYTHLSKNDVDALIQLLLQRQ